MSTNSKEGFTLVELLVVISIISILSVIGITVFNSAQKSARDAKRRADLKAIQTMLEIYYYDNGTYPNSGNRYIYSTSNDIHASEGSNTYIGPDWIPGLVPKYTSKLPLDPQNGSDGICGSTWKKNYIYWSDGQNYAVLDHCAPETTNWDPHSSPVDPQRPTWAWKIYIGTGRDH